MSAARVSAWVVAMHGAGWESQGAGAGCRREAARGRLVSERFVAATGSEMAGYRLALSAWVGGGLD